MHEGDSLDSAVRGVGGHRHMAGPDGKDDNRDVVGGGGYCQVLVRNVRDHSIVVKIKMNHQLISWCLRGIQGSPGKAAI